MNKVITTNKLSAYSLIGIIGTIITIISDFILLGSPISALEFFKQGTQIMTNIDQWRITFGTFLGVIFLPMQIFGIFYIYSILKNSCKLLSLSFLLTTVHGLIMGVAFHISYAYIASGWKLFYEFNNNILLLELTLKFNYYWKINIIILLIDLIISSILFTYIILKKNTPFSKPISLFNPLSIFILMYLIIILIPSPIGGFIAPAYLNISTLIFFIITRGKTF